ncbi:MAG: pyridoxal-phosphate dependent enzyme [Propionibacteriaceae bacterium]
MRADDSATCPACGGVPVLELAALPGPPAVRPATGIWRHADLLPRTEGAVTLGEGRTPLVDLDDPTGRLQVTGKLEGLNPTLSFKDRGMALATTSALDGGMRGLVVASTGNAAASASAYAAAAGLPCRVFVGAESGASGKLAVCRAYQAEVHEVDGDYSAAYAAAEAAVGQGFMNVSTTYRNPIIAEAYRTIALELVEESSEVPEVVVVPIGAGPLLRGVGAGFDDLRSVGLITRSPRLIGVQAAGCAPLARAWRSSGPDGWLADLHRPLRVEPTVATAIADALRGYEEQGMLTLRAVHDSGGEIIAVPDSATTEAEIFLRQQGIWVEPSSAIALAALASLDLAEGTRVTLLLTGHGVKSGGMAP